MFKKIIVGIDFGPVSERAVKSALALAQPLGAEVVLVHVIPAIASYSDPARFIAEVRPAIEEQLREWVNRLGAKSGVKVDWGIVDGQPAEQLGIFAERWGGDMIVTGSAGRTGLPRALLGSVADRLVRTSKVPVLVVGPEVVT